jgi:hypothetical protein
LNIYLISFGFAIFVSLIKIFFEELKFFKIYVSLKKDFEIKPQGIAISFPFKGVLLK